MSLLTKAYAAETELAINGMWTSANLTASVCTYCELWPASSLVLESCLCHLLVLLEWEAEVLKQSLAFLITLGRGYYGDVHTTAVIDGIRIDFMEHRLFG